MAKKKKKLPLAEIHSHIEGTVAPARAEKLADKNGLTLPDWLIRINEDGQKEYVWKSFAEMVTISYDAVARTVQSKQDYEDITYDYLKQCAEEGSIYEELIISANDINSPDHTNADGEAVNTKLVQIPYEDMLDGMTKAVDRARRDFGIETRFSVALIRHMGKDAARYAVDNVLNHRHKLVTSINVAGAETPGDLADYEPFIDELITKTNGELGWAPHVMEATGPQMGWEALALYDRLKKKHGDKLNATLRFGHGVRIMEDPKLVEECRDRGVIFEVCPDSNVKIGVFESYEKHPLREMYDAGLRITLNSDDPPHFHCTVGSQYKLAKEKFGMSDADLIEITRTAIEGAFVDDKTRAKLLAKLPKVDASQLTRGKGRSSRTRSTAKRGPSFRP